MLKIREEQMAVFGARERERLVEELIGHARQRHGVEAREAGRALALVALDRAAALGTDLESDAFRVLDLVVVEGEDFDTRDEPAWVRRIAGDPALDGPGRVALLSAEYARLRELDPDLEDDSDVVFVAS